MATKTLLDARDCDLTLHRLCCQLNEVHFPWNNSVIIGLQPRGTRLAEAIVSRLQREHGINEVPFGALDITFHRDDFRRREEPLAASPNQMDVLVEGKRVIIVDDVLYTGRSVRAAMDALQDYGRPQRVELCVLVDRRFSRELPIQPDYSGRRVDAIAEERVRLEWADDLPSVLIESTPHAAQR
ncbi:bifunctional pyr operon transcriptional regulator/uracil phosphoribosyltransferase PyrR [Schleiferiaceae bacterium]|jgi:pyrimidine operon attenuation protein/uracil phosphoribosyltransferase|nr:bifunctional pyr operon transcriptional regulator/uracil phosphoribosyltransferase PyrR [Schleiferiaceae bacterium]MDA9151388.1 bifunctional pyr operon transcriptional regulator/uracil phosphoribosyltransferase PyrR [Schleiferiaceae bacterium]